MTLDLRKLHHVTVLANERNFTKAAEKLHITQPALSRSISKLESELGLQLFDRSQGEVSLTAVGKNFVTQAEALLEHAQGLDDDIALIREGLSGDLTIGMTHYSAAALLPRLTKDVFHKKEGVNLRVEISSREQLMLQLNAEDIEFVLASSAWFSPGAQYQITPLLRMKLSLYVRNEHPLSSEEISDASVLMRYPFIGAVVPPSQLSSLKFAFGLPPSTNFQLKFACDDFHVLKSLALTSNSILIAPHAAIFNEYQSDEFQELQLAGQLAQLTNASLEVCIIRFANKTLSPAAEATIKLIHRLAKAMGNEPL